MNTAYLALVWHMHQPYYKDLAEGAYSMPWVRLHALKDYYGMVAILREFPSVRVTFNLVPSLVTQIEDYAQDNAREESYEIAFKLAEKLTPGEQERLLNFAFSLNRENLLNRYARFRELYQRVRSAEGRAAARLLTPQDLLDLQVLCQLAWFDEIYVANDPIIRGLVVKERAYTEEDKRILRNKELEIFKAILEEYRDALERGQIEISISPFYHPILPLLCNSKVAADSHPGVKLPRRIFRHPEDARDQLRASVELYERIFGRRPEGLWPSEGSLSDEVLLLAADEGFLWTATDEGVLGRSLQMTFHRQPDGSVTGGQELYRPHRFVAQGRQISVLFRDHYLSDLIGFVYSRMDAQAAAADLHQRIRAAARSTGQRPAVVSIILDGENAWEFYPGNGRQFLRSFYDRVTQDPELRAVTASEAVRVTEPGTLAHVVPGSWINANFDIWIGSEEDNRAWELLNDARDFFAQSAGKTGLEGDKVKLAQHELWVAEGSDWCWWYGPEHSSPHDEEFDMLFRKHLSNIYRLLGGSPPDELAVPIKRPKVHAVNVPPRGRVEATVDGHVTNYFEWLGAGVYTPDYPAGSMHGSGQYLEALYYGCSNEALYLRVDLKEGLSNAPPKFEIRVNVDGESCTRVHASVAKGQLVQVEIWRGDAQLPTPPATPDQFQVAFARILEIRLGYALLGLSQGRKAQVQVSFWVNELPAQVIPQEGWLALELRDDFVSW